MRRVPDGRRWRGHHRAVPQKRSGSADVTRRSYGTGSHYARADATGRETWYARWRIGGRLVHRRIGRKRIAGSNDGLTRTQAERALQRRIDSERPPAEVRISAEDAGAQLIASLEALGRKPTTMATYRSLLRTHISLLGDKPLDRLEAPDVEAWIGEIRRRGTGAKTARNAATLLHQVFAHGVRKGWCRDNPCAKVDLPKLEESADIRFLGHAEVEALMRAIGDNGTRLTLTDRAIYVVATMTGLRQGELLALRWRDVDWAARKIRVRQNYVRRHWGTPKTRRGSRSVPMADRVGAELEHHFQRSAYTGDDDLVFCHPETGAVLDHSALVRRFKGALRTAGVRPVRFNDLRHTFGTRMAAAGVPLRTLQEWMGHRDIKTTQIYADYQPDDGLEAELVERAFRPSSHSSSQFERERAN
ncbi:MAG: tyrosine-type recombinase/integrase [Geminicoccales bacterium]